MASSRKKELLSWFNYKNLTDKILIYDAKWYYSKG